MGLEDVSDEEAIPATAEEDVCKGVGIGVGVEVIKSEDIYAVCDGTTMMLIESETPEVSEICNTSVVEAALDIEVDEVTIVAVKFEASVLAVTEVGWNIWLDEGIADPLPIPIL